jgi:hypothetical protein
MVLDDKYFSSSPCGGHSSLSSLDVDSEESEESEGSSGSGVTVVYNRSPIYVSLASLLSPPQFSFVFFSSQSDGSASVSSSGDNGYSGSAAEDDDEDEEIDMSFETFDDDFGYDVDYDYDLDYDVDYDESFLDEQSFVFVDYEDSSSASSGASSSKEEDFILVSPEAAVDPEVVKDFAADSGAGTTVSEAGPTKVDAKEHPVPPILEIVSGALAQAVDQFSSLVGRFTLNRYGM